MWFDGEVEEGDWKRGEDKVLTIVDITEYHYLGSTCSKESFYECLANRISSMSMEDVKSYDPFCHVDTETSFCLPFSLPSKIPICNKTEPGFSFLDCCLSSSADTPLLPYLGSPSIFLRVMPSFYSLS